MVTETRGVTVRKLKSKDLFTVARIVKNSRGAVEQLIRDSRAPLHKLGSEPTDGGLELDKYAVGSTMVFELLGQAEGEIRPWLADMCQMTPEEFDDLALADTFDAVEQIVKQEDWPAFLGRLSGMISISTTG